MQDLFEEDARGREENVPFVRRHAQGLGDGSATLVQSLLGTDLIDEYRFLVEPFVMGRGRRFFPDGTPSTKLRLVESKALGSGSLALVYQPDRE